VILDNGLSRDPDPEGTGGPRQAGSLAEPDVVWLTAESLGSRDPALVARPALPAVFVFDLPRLARWRLSGKRLVFLAETVGELARERPVELLAGDPAEELAGRRLAATWTPVPGWRRLASRLDVVEQHPWPWLARPHGRSARSFSSWRKALPAERQRGA
jgi:deoxyribodipyrimidine photo-lyase